MSEELQQIDRRLAELRKHSYPGEPFDWDDVEYLRLHSRKLELGYPGRFNASWFAEMAEKLSATLRQLDDLQKQWGERVAALKRELIGEYAPEEPKPEPGDHE